MYTLCSDKNGNVRYVYSVYDTSNALYLLAGVRRLERVQQRCSQVTLSLPGWAVERQCRVSPVSWPVIHLAAVQLKLTVEPPASACCRQVGLHPQFSSSWTSWASFIIKFWTKSWVGLFLKVRTYWAKGNVLNSSKFSFCVWQISCTMTEYHVGSLCCYKSVCWITIKFNSTSQQDQSSWRTFCESLCLKSLR